MLNCSECKNNCCINTQGTIITTKHEAKAIADSLGISIKSFTIPIRGYYTIKIVPYEDRKRCMFLDAVTKLCTIYELRPRSCREFKCTDDNNIKDLI